MLSQPDYNVFKRDYGPDKFLTRISPLPGHVVGFLVLDGPRHRERSPMAEIVLGYHLAVLDALGTNVHVSDADLKRLDEAAPLEGRQGHKTDLQRGK